MSAQLLVLSRIHATAAASSRPARPVTEGALARTAHALNLLGNTDAQPASEQPAHGRLRLAGAAESGRPVHFEPRPAAAEPFAPGVRKGPQRLHLVEAAAEPARAAAPVLELPVGARRMSGTVVGGVPLEFYRTYTEAMLRRYSKLSMEGGRVPSLLGRELFRGHVTSCKVHSFEDVSNFVHDMEQSMQQLTAGQRHLIRRIAVEEYTQGETAALCGLSLRTVTRHYAAALDKLTRVLLDRKLLEPLAPCSCS